HLKEVLWQKLQLKRFRSRSPRARPLKQQSNSPWGQEIESGDITQNSAFRVIYDPARLPNIRNYRSGMPAWDITANLRFHPGLESYNGSVVQKTDTRNGGVTVLNPPRPLPLSVPVPPDAMGLEIWFLNTGMYGDKAWDSRYGENYWFPVAQAGP